MAAHELRFVATPKGLVARTLWGWLAGCVCGWRQEGCAGTKKEARREWRRHKDRMKLESAVELIGEYLAAHGVTMPRAEILCGLMPLLYAAEQWKEREA